MTILAVNAQERWQVCVPDHCNPVGAETTIPFCVFQTNRKFDSFIGILTAAAHTADHAALWELVNARVAAACRCPTPNVENPTTSTETIFSSHVGEKCWLIICVLVPRIFGTIAGWLRNTHVV